MRFASLGSGSEGNGLVVESGATRVLVDCGFGIRDAAARLSRLGLEPRDLAAILVTHEHSDHVGGVPAFAARHAIPVWATFGTIAAVSERFEGMTRVYGFDSHDAFAIGALEIVPIPVPHDAREPVQYVIGDGARRVGVLTDLGVSTPHVEACLDGCDALVLECNHDLAMLEGGTYPYPLKKRIASRLGHLDNVAAGGTPRAPRHFAARPYFRRAPFAAEQHAGARPRRAGRGTWLRAGLDRHRRAGRRLWLARHLTGRPWKSGRNSTRARRRPSTRPTTRTGSSCITATTFPLSTEQSSPSSRRRARPTTSSTPT